MNTELEQFTALFSKQEQACSLPSETSCLILRIDHCKYKPESSSAFLAHQQEWAARHPQQIASPNSHQHKMYWEDTKAVIHSYSLKYIIFATCKVIYAICIYTFYFWNLSTILHIVIVCSFSLLYSMALGKNVII